MVGNTWKMLILGILSIWAVVSIHNCSLKVQQWCCKGVEGLGTVCRVHRATHWQSNESEVILTFHGNQDSFS